MALKTVESQNLNFIAMKLELKIYILFFLYYTVLKKIDFKKI